MYKTFDHQSYAGKYQDILVSLNTDAHTVSAVVFRFTARSARLATLSIGYLTELSLAPS